MSVSSSMAWNESLGRRGVLPCWPEPLTPPSLPWWLTWSSCCPPSASWAKKIRMSWQHLHAFHRSRPDCSSNSASLGAYYKIVAILCIFCSMNFNIKGITSSVNQLICAYGHVMLTSCKMRCKIAQYKCHTDLLNDNFLFIVLYLFCLFVKKEEE